MRNGEEGTPVAVGVVVTVGIAVVVPVGVAVTVPVEVAVTVAVVVAVAVPVAVAVAVAVAVPVVVDVAVGTTSATGANASPRKAEFVTVFVAKTEIVPVGIWLKPVASVTL